VLVVAALLAGLAIWLTRDNADYQQYEMSTKDGVSGLQPQAAVRYKGVSVGKVTRISFDPQVEGNVLIRIAVNEQAPIGTKTYAVLGYQGVTGLAHVLLDDEDQAIEPLPRGPSGLPRLPLKTSPFGRIAEQAPNILSQVEDTSHRLNALLSDENQKLFTQALSNMGEAAHSVNALSQRLDATVTQRLDPALASLEPLSSEARKTLQSLQQAGHNVSTLAADLGKTTQRLSAEGGAIDQITQGTQSLARAADQFGATTLPRVNRAMDDTSSAARQLRRVANGVTDNPQSFIYGSGAVQPGPGEPGFKAP
jgi:phospholipid/cholesterol/gamma-HCH transport system substrate-binding protein